MADGTDVKQLLLQIDANTQLLRSNLSQAEREISNFQRKAEGSVSATDRAFGSLGGSLQRLDKAFAPIKAGLAGLAAGIIAVGVVGAGRKFLSFADQSKQMAVQLKLATAEFGTFAQAQEDVQRIAAETRNGLEPTAALYATFARNSAALGRSQADAARATETFGKALKIGGAGANEAASATLQFSQALASGVLRGDEFNSIAEASPRIMKLLADSLGVPVGKLRAMAAEGKLTADILYTALTDRKFTAGIDAEFTQLPSTFDEAMTAVHDAAVTAFGAFDRGGDFSTMIAGFVQDGAGSFKSLADSAEDTGIQVRAAFAGLSTIFDPMVQAAGEATGIMSRKFFDLRNDIAQVLGFIDEIRNLPIDAADFIRGGNAQFRKATGYVSPDANKRSTMREDYLRVFDARASERRGASAMRGLDEMFGTYSIGTPLTSDTLFGPKLPRVTPPLAAASTKTGRGRTGKAAVDSVSKALDEALIKAQNLDIELAKIGYGDADKAANDRAGSFYSSLGIDVKGDLKSIFSEIDATRDRQVQANQQATEDFRDRQSSAIREVGDLYYDLFTGGTKSLWNDFKRMGLDAVSQVLAKWTVTKLFPSSGGSLAAGLQSLLGFADGGVISGPGGPRSDSILAAVSNGEFIVNAAATSRNLALLQAINDNKVPRFASGGLVSPSLAMPRLPDLRGVGGGAHGGGGPAVHNHFHITGAVMTQDLIDQMNAIGQAAVVGGAGMAQARMTRAAGRRLGS